jgi:hypothetical protein
LTPQQAKRILANLTRRNKWIAWRVRQVDVLIATCFFAVLRQKLMDSLVEGNGCTSESRAKVAEEVLEAHHLKRVEHLISGSQVISESKGKPAAFIISPEQNEDADQHDEADQHGEGISRERPGLEPDRLARAHEPRTRGPR